jgi:hypothetical protein
MKCKLSDAEKAAIVERQRALILASRPNVIVSIYVENETDDNGDPISQITIRDLEKLPEQTIAGIFGVNSTESKRERSGIIRKKIRGA